MQRVIILAWALSIAAAAQEPPSDEKSAAADAAGTTGAEVSDAPPVDDSGAIYRRRGEDGSVEFSDSPSPDAERVEIREMQTIEAPPPPSFIYERPQKEQVAYTRVAIVDPPDDAQIRENTGNVTVAVAVEPDLAVADQVVILVDGQEAAAGKQTTFDLSNVDRGTHRLTAIVRNPDGKTAISSPAVTFHMLRFFDTRPAAAPKPAPAKAN